MKNKANYFRQPKRTAKSEIGKLVDELLGSLKFKMNTREHEMIRAKLYALMSVSIRMGWTQLDARIERGLDNTPWPEDKIQSEVKSWAGETSENTTCLSGNSEEKS